MDRRKLHYFWICDRSGSMAGDKIQQLNTAISESVPHLQSAGESNPFVRMVIHTVTFANEAGWVEKGGVPLEQFSWRPVTHVPHGVTNTGKALGLVLDELENPPFLKNLFLKTFVEGLHAPERRTRLTEWLWAYLQMRDRIQPCVHCWQENLYHPEKTGSHPGVCLSPQTYLTEMHLTPTTWLDGLNKIAAIVEPHPTQPGLLGLKNLSSSPWTFTSAEGTYSIDPGKTINFTSPSMFRFGLTQAELRVG